MKINTADTEKLTAAILAAEGRASARTVAASDVQALVRFAERELGALLPKSYWSGAKAHYFPPSVPNSYNYRADGTYFSITRGSREWYLTDVSRGRVGSQSYGGSSKRRIELSVDQQLQLVATHPLLGGIVAAPREVLPPLPTTSL